MKRALNISLLFSLVLGWFAFFRWLPAYAQPQAPYTIPAGIVVQGNVSTITESIVVDGVVSGDVTSWSGDITIHGLVEGDVVTYAGEVSVTSGGQINGHVLSLGGPLHSEGTIGGQALDSTQLPAASRVAGALVPSDVPTPGSSFVRGLLASALAIIVLAVSLLFATFLPRRTMAATMTLQHHLGRAIALGLLTSVVMIVLLLPLVTLLTASIIGLPIAVLLILAMGVPYAWGLIVLGHAFVGQQTPGISVRVVLVTALLITIIAVMCYAASSTGLVVSLVLASPGIGAVLLSRGGLYAIGNLKSTA